MGDQRNGRHVVRRVAGSLGLLVLAAILYFILSSPLPGFSRRIAGADRIVVSMSHSPVTLVITGEDVKGICRAVSSASRERMGDECFYDITATFFKGAKPLGDILACASLFLADGRKYHDSSGLLAKLVVVPINQKYDEWAARQMSAK